MTYPLDRGPFGICKSTLALNLTPLETKNCFRTVKLAAVSLQKYRKVKVASVCSASLLQAVRHFPELHERCTPTSQFLWNSPSLRQDKYGRGDQDTDGAMRVVTLCPGSWGPARFFPPPAKVSLA